MHITLLLIAAIIMRPANSFLLLLLMLLSLFIRIFFSFGTLPVTVVGVCLFFQSTFRIVAE